MKHASLIAAAVLVLLANTFALLHAARNRSGTVDSDIVLTDRELHYYPDVDDSGVSLQLNWLDPATPRYSTTLKPDDPEMRTWLDRPKLIELGFDCSVEPANSDAYSFYNRQSARTAFVALEYNGAAWRSWLEGELRNPQPGQPMIGQESPFEYQRRGGSQLVIVDAALDSSALRARHPERDRVLIAPAVIHVSVLGPKGPGRRSYLSGYVREIPSSIHVQRPFSDRFREPGAVLTRDTKRDRALYRVRLRYGAFLEPWVTDVEFVK